MPPAAAPAASFGSSVLFPLQIVWALHRRAVLAGTPRRWGCVSRSGVQPGAWFSSGVPGSGCGMERPRPFPSAAERGWRSGSGSGTAERCRGTAGFILFYFKSPFPGVFGAVGAWPGGLSSLCVPAGDPRCPRAVRSRSPERVAPAPLSPTGDKGENRGIAGKKRHGTLRVLSPTLPPLFPQPSRSGLHPEHRGAPGRSRPEEDAAPRGEPLDGGRREGDPQNLACQFKMSFSQPALLFQSVSLEHLILIIRGIQPSNCDWEGEIKATPQIQVLSAASPRKNRGS